MRPATCDDIPRITDMVERLQRVAQIPQTPDRAHTQASLARLILRDDAIVLVTNGGFIAGSIECTVISPEPIAVEHGWYSQDRSGLRLLRAFEAWATARHARVRLSTGMAVGPDYLVRLGYMPVELAWVK